MQVNIDNTLIDTKRLLLRKWQETDLDDFFAYASVPGVGEMAGWGHHQTIEETKEVLDQYIKRNDSFAVVFKENQRVIGSIGIKTKNDNR